MRMLLSAFMAAAPIAASAQDIEPEPRYLDSEMYEEVIRSDLPLYTFIWSDLWPRNFNSEGSFGCQTRVAFGDWQFTAVLADTYSDSSWMRVTNYGVFHCAAVFSEALEREELGQAGFEFGFFVKIGEAQRPEGLVELWVIQEGFIPGSQYSLLARAPQGDMIEAFTVLQSRCPEGAMRELDEGMDVWRTGYCAINTREDLLVLAIEMLDYPPLGTLTRQGDIDWEAPPEVEEEPPIIEDGSFLLEPEAE